MATTAKSRVPMWQQAIGFHRELYPDDFGVVVRDEHYYPKLAQILIERRSRRTHGYLDIQPLSSSLIPSSGKPVVVRGKGGQRLMFADASGAFRVRLSKDEVVHIVRFRLNNSVATEYAIGTRAGMLALHNLCNVGVQKVVRKLPRKGVWDGQVDRAGSYYMKLKRDVVQEAERFADHPMYGSLEADFLQFFEEIDLYTRYGQPGMRKVLLSGPPGTGKTTLARALAAKHSAKVVCVQADGESFQEVCYDAAKWRIPTLVIAEEVEELYRAGANTLSFLDGMRTPRNTVGTYVVFSTNYPKRIDPRIMKRPGRIDRVVPVGAFRRKAALACARMYLPQDCQIADKDLGAVLDRTTPAEIKEIIITALGITRATKRELSGEVLAMARKHLTGSLKWGVDVCAEDMDTRDELHKRLGPEPDYSEYATDEES